MRSEKPLFDPSRNLVSFKKATSENLLQYDFGKQLSVLSLPKVLYATATAPKDTILPHIYTE